MKLAGTALLALIVVGAFAHQGTVQGESHKDIWQPNRTLKDQNITVVPWGSGSISQTDETSNDGAYALRVSTHNYFQGGLVKLHSPIDVSADYSDASSMLAVSIRNADTVVLGGGNPGGPNGGKGGGISGGGIGGPGSLGGRPGAPGGPGGRFGGGAGVGGGGGGAGVGGGGGAGVGGGGGQTPGGFPGGGRLGGVQGGGAPGQFGGTGGPPGLGGGRGGNAQSKTPKAKLDTIRLIISTTDGKKSEAYLPLPVASSTHPWTEVAIPLQKIAGFENTNKVIDGVGISGDATATFYVGDLRLEHDPTPITGDMNVTEPLNLALGDTVPFIGYGDGGATILKYVWCFDSANGFSEDADGQGVRHKFRKAGNFVVTLQIQDYFGLKAPYTKTVAVTVNP